MNSRGPLSNDAGDADPVAGAPSRDGQQLHVTMMPLSELLRHVPDRQVPMPNTATHVIDEYIIQESLQPFAISYVADVLEDGQSGLRVGVESPTASSPDTGERRNTAPARATARAAKTESTQIPASNPTLEPVLSPLVALAAAISQDPIPTMDPNLAVIPVPSPPLIPIPITRATAEQTPRLRVLGRRHVPTSTRPPLLRIKPPRSWTVDEVAHYIQRLPGCAKYAEEFRGQLIDGEALFLLNEHHLVNAMSLKLGPAVKICAVIRSLRETL